jgi:hypothetical protein
MNNSLTDTLINIAAKIVVDDSIGAFNDIIELIAVEKYNFLKNDDNLKALNSAVITALMMSTISYETEKNQDFIEEKNEDIIVMNITKELKNLFETMPDEMKNIKTDDSFKAFRKAYTGKDVVY